jgi:hypothetical protein
MTCGKKVEDVGIATHGAQQCQGRIVRQDGGKEREPEEKEDATWIIRSE